MYNETRRIMLDIKKKIEFIDQVKVRNKDVIQQEQEIRDQLHNCEDLISQLNEILKKQANKPKQYDRNDVNKRDKMYIFIKEELQILMDKRGLQQEGGNQIDIQQIQLVSLSQMKQNIMNGNKSNFNNQYRNEANDQEKQAMEQFKKKDEEMDLVLDRINDHADILKGKAIQIGDKLDVAGQKIQQLNQKVDQTSNQLDSSNKKMKELLKKYREPNKFCLDFILIAFLLGLLGVGYTMIK
ncbi:syntaxin-73, putative [Ichthyophthirius multifiliis]|uniref:Syntaxin-73, putative n=1 Tax=Ichthyophthirius multifiliis TaxID=5932 RepID=G0R654_ICHMU|nr:syntaxin-73, putative [Ichthyophthirius multifiliis]EGR27053.1 syntaxin-73, putative [Ichthyophthirius multifiliis]|eukprot:XP_004023937.1 syntaxin-73, putative [Ichthyophthirius multifiliis]